MLRRWIVLLGLLLIPSVTNAQGTTTNPGQRQIASPDPFARLRIGQRVRWMETGSASLEGRVRGRTDSTLLIQSGGGSRSVPRVAIDSLWVRGNAAGQGALIGGATLGVVLGLMAKEIEEGFGGSETNSAFATGFGVGAAGGLLVGAIIGAAVPRWRRRIP